MAKYFDLRKAEKKTSGILADWLKKKKKKRQKSEREIWRQEENPAENQAWLFKQLQDVLLGGSEKHVRKMLEWT